MGISAQQALDCFASDDLIGIGMEADAVRRTLHPEGVVTYTLESAIAYTDSLQSIFAAVTNAMTEGATGLTLTECPSEDLTRITQLLGQLKLRFPQLRLRSFSAPDILAISTASALPVREVLQRLKIAGLDAISGSGADPRDPSAGIEVHRAAHQAGLSSDACMTFGAGESSLERVAFLQLIYDLQRETQGFEAFSLTSAHSPSNRDLDDPTAVEYLKTLSVCRMILDNIPHVHCDWQQQGLKVLQTGLRFGGNDTGSIFGSNAHAPEEEIRRIIRDAGFRPVQRDPLYRSVFVN